MMMTTQYAPSVERNKGELARLIGELLHSRGMSQVQLARSAGVSESHISRILKGEHFPAPDKLGPLADALGVPEEMLHRAYAMSIGIRLEGVDLPIDGLAATLAQWPNLSPEVQAAAAAAAAAVIRALGHEQTPKGDGQ